MRSCVEKIITTKENPEKYLSLLFPRTLGVGNAVHRHQSAGCGVGGELF
jgi:hypothetical protein